MRSHSSIPAMRRRHAARRPRRRRLVRLSAHASGPAPDLLSPRAVRRRKLSLFLWRRSVGCAGGLVDRDVPDQPRQRANAAARAAVDAAVTAARAADARHAAAMLRRPAAPCVDPARARQSGGAAGAGCTAGHVAVHVDALGGRKAFVCSHLTGWQLRDRARQCRGNAY